MYRQPYSRFLKELFSTGLKSSRTDPNNSEPPVMPVVFLFGPTGVGKTALIEGLSGDEYEIISADSMQVYRGMDIGTAKPDSHTLLHIPHHLLNICNPDEQFHLGEFIRLADKACRKILNSGKLPVLSGGTAYYFKHFLYGLPRAPEADKEIRRLLNVEVEQKGLTRLFDELRQVDPVSAERIAPADQYRILRALEVYRSSGFPLSSFELPDKPRKNIVPCIIGLDRPREELYLRINQRVQAMFTMGLRAEVENLMQQGFSLNDPGMRAIGYREFFTSQENDDNSIMQQIQLNSRRYAKRQLTFFRSIPGTFWADPEDAEKILSMIDKFRKKYNP